MDIWCGRRSLSLGKRTLRGRICCVEGEGMRCRIPVLGKELPDIAPVDTHGWDFSAAVFMEFIATCLTPKPIQQELLADVTESKL